MVVFLKKRSSSIDDLVDCDERPDECSRASAHKDAIIQVRLRSCGLPLPGGVDQLAIELLS
jgi:hypothetical protein